MRYLHVNEVLHLHALEVGSEVPLRDRGLLEAAVARPQQSAFGEDAYPTLHLKAAALLQSPAQNQAFEDGNKRVAVLATFVFLGLNGLDVEIDDGSVVALMIDIAVVPLTIEQIAERLKRWTVPKAADPST